MSFLWGIKYYLDCILFHKSQAYLYLTYTSSVEVNIKGSCKDMTLIIISSRSPLSKKKPVKLLMNFSFTQLATYSVIFRYFLRFLLNQNYIYVLLRSKPWNKQNLKNKKQNKNKKMLSCGKGSKCLVDKSYFPFTENGRSRLYHMFKFLNLSEIFFL